MANKFQKIIYNFSAIVPLCLIFSIVWCIQKGTYIVPIALVSSGIGLIVMFIWSFKYGKRNLAPIQIRVSDLSPNDSWLIAYVISYILPFGNIVLQDFNLWVCGIIAMILIISMPFVNTTMPNPLLSIKGYHFYQISAENGVSGYVLISKRKLRRKQDLRNIKRIFEFLLLDVERG